MAIENHKSEVLSVQMWVQTGSANETKGEEGVSHFIEHLLFKGTNKFGMGEVAKLIEESGGEINAYTSYDQTVYYLTVPASAARLGFECLSEMTFKPKFAQSDIDNEREVVLEEIKRSQDSLSKVGSLLFFSTHFQGHPYGKPVIGSEKVIRTISRKRILSYYQSHYRPKNMTLVVAGALKLAEIEALANQYFLFSPPRSVASKRTNSLLKLPSKLKLPSEPSSLNGKSLAASLRSKPKVRVSSSPFEEMLVYLGWSIPFVKHKDIPALDVLAMILGQGETSRLVRGLRLERPLVNSISATTYTPKHPGAFIISFSLREEDLNEALNAIKGQLSELWKVKVDEAELKKVIHQYKSSQFFSSETTDGLARKLGGFENLFGDYEHFDKFLKQVELVTSQDLQRVAKAYLNPRIMTAVAVDKKNSEKNQALLTSWGNDLIRVFQEKSPDKETVKKNKKGLVKKTKPLELRREILPGGTRIAAHVDLQLPIVSLKVGFLGGTRSENASTQGLSEVLVRSWLGGSSKLNEKEFHEKLERRAIKMSAFGGRNSMGVNVACLSEDLEEALFCLEQALCAPSFPNEVVEREKTMLAEEDRTQTDSPSHLVYQAFLEQMFSSHPYGFNPLGTSESRKEINSLSLINHFSSLTRQANLVVSAAGQFDLEYLRDRFAVISSKLPQGNLNLRMEPIRYPSEDSFRFRKTDRAQSHIILGYPGLRVADKDRYVLGVVHGLLAGQGGRLFVELREKKSLAYSVSPIHMEGIDGGYFGGYIACSPEKANQALVDLEAEFKRLAEEQVPAAELRRAKNYLVGNYHISKQRLSAIASQNLFDDLYGIPAAESLAYPERILDVSADEVSAFCQKMFSKPKVVSAVGLESPWRF